jgi:2-aminoethylphosphonate-pyruvate transaminase
MTKLGFESYLPEDRRGHIISSFLYPEDDNFDFETFYDKLNDRGYVIYPGKVSDADCFRIGNIGRIFEADVAALLGEIRCVLAEMQVRMPESLVSK